MQSLGHPVVGDTLYGAARSITPNAAAAAKGASLHPIDDHPAEWPALRLERNFLHAAHLEFAHPRTGKALAIDAPLPAELEEFLARLRTQRAAVG
jgi:23S rRNA pseudouridine1911/1915/1917 synthase